MTHEATAQADTTSADDAAVISEITTKRARKRIDLSKAKVADGEVRTHTSVYEIMGVSTHGYHTTNASQYSQELRAMNLLQLQDEAYRRAITPTDNREMLLDRLERRFLQETSKFKTAEGRSFTKEPDGEVSLKDQALRVLSRGR